MTAATGPTGFNDRQSATQPRMLGGIVLVAIAAGAVAYVTVRGFAERTPAAPPAAAAQAVTQPAQSPPPAATTIPLDTESSVAKPKHFAPPVAPKTKVVVEPSPVGVASPGGPGTAVAASPSAPAAPPSPQPSLQQYPAAKPAPADQALSAGEFGGRE